MEFQLDMLSENDRKPVIDIFNHYIENSFAAYLENKVDYTFYDHFLKMVKGFPSLTIKTKNGEVIGFGFLHPYHPFPIFRRAAEITYFIEPEYTRKGIGSIILEFLIKEAKKMNIDLILANISSYNEMSINFRKKHGFVECGKFRRIGKKFNKDFDIIWMQKEI